MMPQANTESSAPAAPARPVIVIRRKKKGHAGHHGGAWKVAYADFVTAMMALFMVLWIIGQSSKAAKEAIADYFRHPGIFTTTGAGGRKIVPIVPDPTTSGESGSFNMPPAKTPPEALADILRRQQNTQEQAFKQVGEQLRTRLAAQPELQRLKEQVSI